jgi:8-oxo-dGTP diphosphatase
VAARIKRSVALLAHPPGDRERVLLVQRPDVPGEELPGVWGLPAASLRPREGEEEAARRVGWQKLGCGVRLLRVLGRGVQDRPGYRLEMAVYEAELEEQVPRLPQTGEEEVTYYVAWRFGRPEDLREAAARGSLCARVALGAQNPGGRSPGQTAQR